MKFRNLLAATAALSMAASPALAQSDFRTSAPVSGESNFVGGGGGGGDQTDGSAIILAILAAAAIITGIIIAAGGGNDDDPISA